MLVWTSGGLTLYLLRWCLARVLKVKGKLQGAAEHDWKQPMRLSMEAAGIIAAAL